MRAVSARLQTGELSVAAGVLAELFDHAPDLAFFVKDGAGRYVAVNTSLINYRVPRIFEATEIETAYVETNDPRGPLGAKSSGEVSINPTVAAIANAVAHATGIRFRTLAKLCAALECRPGDLLDYDFDAADLAAVDED